ncbi:hypothetical protein Tco_1481897 [Tanacetum coccineum]
MGMGTRMGKRLRNGDGDEAEKRGWGWVVITVKPLRCQMNELHGRKEVDFELREFKDTASLYLGAESFSIIDRIFSCYEFIEFQALTSALTYGDFGSHSFIIRH